MRIRFILLFLIAATAARADFREFRAVARDPQIETALRHAADASLKEFPKLASNDLAISVVDVTRPELLARGDYHGDAPFYPASVIKLFFMAETFHQKKEAEKEVDRALKEMIRVSDNDATAFILDTISDTCSGPWLEGRALAKFIDKRRVVNKWLQPMGYDVSAMSKPWSFGPFGRDVQVLGENKENRNRPSADPVALLLLAIVAMLLGKRHARRLQRARKIHVDRFKLKRRHAVIELEVFGSRDVVEAVREYAKSHHVSVEEATKQAKTYLREIVPKFNLLAYYRLGAPIASAIMHLLYRPVVERKRLRDFDKTAPRNASVVYIINHRSNADYALVAHMLFKFISLSYAVGEWARVWPLNHLFKWFGAYFIRRRYREPLYHAVLSSFVQTITSNGVTQGIFIEGGLTRDGAFQKPKLGMLDYIVNSKRDPEFEQPLVLMPTAINYDRVLEDRNLTEELMGREDRSTKIEKINTTLEFLFKNLFRSALKRFKRYGYAIVTFGKPVSVDDFIAAHPEVLAPDFEERKDALNALAEQVMTEISRALALTPVTLAARLFTRRETWSDADMCDALERERAAFSDRVWLPREKTGAELWKAAREIVSMRRLIEARDGARSWNPAEMR